MLHWRRILGHLQIIILNINSVFCNTFLLILHCKPCYIRIYIYTSPSVSVASRRITPSQRPLRDLCSLVFGTTRLKETTKKKIIFDPIWLWNQVNPTIFEICLPYENNNNKYSYEKFLNAKFGISILVYCY